MIDAYTAVIVHFNLADGANVAAGKQRVRDEFPACINNYTGWTPALAAANPTVVGFRFLVQNQYDPQ